MPTNPNMAALHAEVAAIRTDVAGLKTDVAVLRSKQNEVISDVHRTYNKVDKVEAAMFRGNGKEPLTVRVSTLEASQRRHSGDPVGWKVFGALITLGSALGTAVIQGMFLLLATLVKG